ncbi:HesA/MoeB/ThiF family protein [Pseudoalteromonas sp. SMS1]|uniref:HesA/MoeB/ThiF family protein n=1 Tax=Pseudoalteromonas sp. SMS1 TaxID=2908894 RepID=UPI001F1FEA48|nr:HesA/MoeB/ThiF family protein [Pseudoalteromonas sp. SMS1]MCF2858488.1 HesA/MoeB/ThiF family protein [Pseudoalteromonas sp. SMS1]
MSRYDRQMILPQVGEQGQTRLTQATVLVVGAGGLGCPVLQYLAGAGIGHIIVVDHDVIECSNLHRQPLYSEHMQGKSKAQSAKQVLTALNQDITVTAHDVRLTPSNARDWVSQADVVLDCADSYAVSYTLSDLCCELNTPFISASALGVTGYVGGFCGGAPSLRALFPALPNNTATCASAGVLGPVVGVIGSLQAHMALNVLLDASPSVLGMLVNVPLDSFAMSSFRFDGAPEPQHAAFSFISHEDIREHDYVVELRNEQEASLPITPHAKRAAVQDFEQGCVPPNHTSRAVMCCRSGIRAWRAADALRRNWPGEIALVAMG